MTVAMKLVFSVFSGLALGVMAMFLTLAVAVSYAFAARTTAFVPGVLTAWITTENDFPAVNFEPNGPGSVIVIGAVTLIVVLAAFSRRRSIRP